MDNQRSPDPWAWHLADLRERMTRLNGLMGLLEQNDQEWVRCLVACVMVDEAITLRIRVLRIVREDSSSLPDLRTQVQVATDAARADGLRPGGGG